MMGWHTGGFTSAGWMMMSLAMLGVWALLVYVGYVLGRASGGDTRAPRGQASTQQLLEERFARGDIDADEYTSRLDILTRSRR